MSRASGHTAERRHPGHAPLSAAPGVLRRAMQAHQAGDLGTAEQLYQEVLTLRVAQPDALHYLGVLCHQRGRSDEAVELIQAALLITPKHPDAHNNLGNVHKECGRLGLAEACYRKALQCAPAHTDALCNLGVVLAAQGRVDEALAAYAQLSQQAPKFAYGHYLRGILLRQRAASERDIEESVDSLRTAAQLDRSHSRALEALGVSLYVLGRHGDAQKVYREWSHREPENPVPRHLLAATGGAPVPPRADDDYVRETFDQFADSFDDQLLHNLDYRAPQLLADALKAVLVPIDRGYDMLDAGCGTGLCAPLLRALARRLDGVDLSSGMIAKARGRGGYDELVAAELTAYLCGQRDAYDVVLSADTLIYFGDLEPVLVAARGALRPEGWLAFTLEMLEGDGDALELSASGRYQHTRAYVLHALEAAGFDDVALSRATLRKEVGRPVPGWVVLARRLDGNALMIGADRVDGWRDHVQGFGDGTNG